MRSHSVTCYPAEVTFPPLPQPKLVLDLATPEGCKAELNLDDDDDDDDDDDFSRSEVRTILGGKFSTYTNSDNVKAQAVTCER